MAPRPVDTATGFTAQNTSEKKTALYKRRAQVNLPDADDVVRYASNKSCHKAAGIYIRGKQFAIKTS